MKYSEMNQKQQKAFRNVMYAAYDLIGGLENAMMDNEEGSPEYESAKATLADHEGLVAMLYSEATTAVYDEGGCIFNTAFCTKYLREINFCGKDFIMERCEKRVTKMGY